MQKSSAIVLAFVLVLCIMVTPAPAKLTQRDVDSQLISITATWAAAISGNISNPLMWTGGLLPSLLTVNTLINAQGNFTVNVGANLALNGALTIGGSGSAPVFSVAPGVVLTVNGALTLLSGSINLATGATIMANGGITVTATSPIVINLNGSLNFNILQVSAASASISTALTINGRVNLTLTNTITTVVNTALMINVPINIAISTVVNTLGSGSLIIGAGVNTVGLGSVSLLANVAIMPMATINLNAGLILLRLNLTAGATVVINASPFINPALNILGPLTIGANLIINGMTMPTLNVAIASSISGSFNLLTPGIALSASANVITAIDI